MIVPKLAFDRLAFGVLKFVRLNRLNASKRNSSARVVAAEAEALVQAEIELPERGPRTTLRGALPNGWVRSVGISTVAGFR